MSENLDLLLSLKYTVQIQFCYKLWNHRSHATSTTERENCRWNRYVLRYA